MSMKEGSVFIERATLNCGEDHAKMSSGRIDVIECKECDREFVIIHISRVPEESGEHHHVAIQLDKENISACPYCGKK